MRTLDPIKQYLALQERLQREKTQLQQRLGEIDQALAGASTRLGMVRGIGNNRRGVTTKPSQHVRRIQNELSLKQAILKAIAKRPLSRREILQQVQKLGYRFASSNPLNTLGATLYGNKKLFKNKGGQFSPAK
jgi:predicted DNA-binding transcriptional regulator